MKPSAYMPFYGNDFFSATLGFTPLQKCAYLLALWHYWSHCNCEGLPDDDEYLRLVCACEASEWDQTRRVIFDNKRFFTLEDGQWQQRRAQDEYLKSKRLYEKRVSIAANARSNINPNTRTNDRANIRLQSESESDITLKSNKRALFAPPTLDEVKAKALETGMPESEAEKFWNYHSARGWMMGRVKMKSWPHALATWKANAAQFSPSFSPGCHTTGLSGAEQVTHTKEYERVIERIRKLSDGAATDAFGSKHWTEKEREELKRLRARRDELKTKLGIIV